MGGESKEKRSGEFGVCGRGPGTEVPRTECSSGEGSHHSSQVCM